MAARQARAVGWFLALALSSAGCARQDSRIQQHREALDSLGATTHAVVGAWLDGRVSGTYTQVALERTFLMVERERAALASRPEALIDRRGADLADAADSLSRTVAALLHSVRGADGAAARAQLANIPLHSATELP